MMLEIQIQDKRNGFQANTVALPVPENKADSHEQQLMTPELFAACLLEKKIPVNPNRAIEVGRAILEGGGTPELLKKLASCFRFIDQDEFYHDIDLMAQEVISAFKDKEYNLTLYEDRGKSGDWIFNLLQQRGVPTPAADIDMFQYSLDNTLHRPNMLTDDWSLAGAQVKSVVGKILRAAREDGSDLVPEIHVFLLYCTNEVVRLLEGAGVKVHIASKEPILTLDEVLDENEKEMLRKIKLNKPYQKNIFVLWPAHLTFGWWKVPDRFYQLFLDDSPLSLVQTNDFAPPYYKNDE